MHRKFVITKGERKTFNTTKRQQTKPTESTESNIQVEEQLNGALAALVLLSLGHWRLPPPGELFAHWAGPGNTFAMGLSPSTPKASTAIDSTLLLCQAAALALAMVPGPLLQPPMQPQGGSEIEGGRL